jgi:hypothetical protein
VALAYDSMLDAWHVDELLGVDNRPIRRAMRIQILGTFAAAGFAYLPHPTWVEESW